MSKRTLRRKSKDAIIERDGGICAYCGDDATVVDHIIPFDWGYDDSEDNLVASCELCNLLASNMVFDSLNAKRKYILDVRSKRRKPLKRRIFTCIVCKNAFVPLAKGATNFMCKECVKVWC